MSSPQLEDGFLKLANETVEALSRTNLSPYEWRFLMVLFRKTYGWDKKDDWIALSQIVAMTGMHKSHVSRAKRLLILRNIVTPRGNKLAFNKYHTQWRELPHGVNNHAKKNVTPRGNLPPAPLGNLGVPRGAHTKDNVTTNTFTKESGSAVKKLTDDEAGRAFRQAIVENLWGDNHYADKTWDQGCQLSGDDRIEFMRKVRYMLAIVSRLPGKAKIVFHEISGLVNDRGAMANRLTPQEKLSREEFADRQESE